jgi:integrase/recombinase XerD
VTAGSDHSSSTTAVAVVHAAFTDAERYALAAFLAAFLAGYRGLTRDAYAVDLGQFIAWCDAHSLRLFGVRREEGPLERSPAAHVRRPRLDYESHATGLDRNEVGALARGRWLGVSPRARPDLAVGHQRPASLRGAWR